MKIGQNVSKFNMNQLRSGTVFSERELMFMFAICRHASVCSLSVVCRSSVCL